jgi:hypothetical protein
MSDVPHPVHEPEGYPLPPFEWDDWEQDHDEDDAPLPSPWPTIEDWWSV